MIWLVLTLAALAVVFAVIPRAAGSLARRLYDWLTNRNAQGP